MFFFRKDSPIIKKRSLTEVKELHIARLCLPSKVKTKTRMKSSRMPYEIREKLMEINLSARTHLSSTPTGSQLGTGTHAFTLCKEGSVRQ